MAEFRPTTIPDYTAGLLFGMTGVNDQFFLRNCMTGETGIATDATKAWDAIINADVLKAGINITKVIFDLMEEIKGCPADVYWTVMALSDWATIFYEPARLSATVSKNLLIGQRKIRKLINQEIDQCNNNEWFNAGVTMSELAVRILGDPHVDPEIFGIDPRAIPEFVAGYIFDFTGNNHLYEIEQCFNDSMAIYIYTKSGISHINDAISQPGFGPMDFLPAAGSFGRAATEVPNSISSCSQVYQDLQAIAEWATIFGQNHRDELQATLTINWAFYRFELKDLIFQAYEHWVLSNYFDSGVVTSQAMRQAVGPVNEEMKSAMHFLY